MNNLSKDSFCRAAAFGYLCGSKIHSKTTFMEKHLEYTTIGTCSKMIDVTVDGDTIRNVEFAGGCMGNTLGIGALVRGMNVDEAIARLEGIDCRGRGTSCPDQLACALREIKRMQ